MNSSGKAVMMSLVVIALGVGWLLNAMNVIPNVNWVWTIGLAMAGILILAISGLNRTTMVTGPWLILASLFSVLRQTGRMAVDKEVPALVIAFGVLMLASQPMKAGRGKGA